MRPRSAPKSLRVGRTSAFGLPLRSARTTGAAGNTGHPADRARAAPRETRAAISRAMEVFPEEGYPAMRVSLPSGMPVGPEPVLGLLDEEVEGLEPGLGCAGCGIEVGLRHEAAFGKGVQHLPVGATGAREVEAVVRVVGDTVSVGMAALSWEGQWNLESGVGAESSRGHRNGGLARCAGRMRGPPAGGCPTYGGCSGAGVGWVVMHPS